MSDQEKALLAGELETPKGETLVKNQAGAVAAATEEEKQANLMHPPGDVCVKGFVRRVDHTLIGIAVKVYNKVDPGNPSTPPAGSEQVVPPPVGDKYEFLYPLIGTARGTAAGYALNWVLLWTKWQATNVAAGGATPDCAWELEIKDQFTGISSPKTECEQ